MTRTLLILVLATAAGTASVSAQEVQEFRGGPEAAAAKQDIEQLGYRDVRGLAEDSQGVWHGRALRGNTEVQLLVDQDGQVMINR